MRLNIRKGYVQVLLFVLFLAIVSAYKYQYFTYRRHLPQFYERLVAHATLMFVPFIVPGWLLVRWYYKLKDNHGRNQG